MGIAEAGGFAEPDAVDQAGMIQASLMTASSFVEQCFERAAVGVEAGTVEDRILGAEKRAEGLFELYVKILRAADEADGGHAVAIFFQSVGGGLSDLRMIGEPEIIVGAEIEDFALRHANLRPSEGREICRSDL